MNVKETNEIIAHASELIDYQVSKRGLLESQLFPVTAYICVSFYNSYDILYDILKRVSEKTTPEKMGKESRRILSEIQALSIFYIPLYYMAGRMGEIYRNNEDPRSESEDKRKQTMFIMDFWKRLASSYFPNGELSVNDSDRKNIALNQSDVDWALEQITDVSKEQAIKIKRAMANLELVSYIDECEARAKLCDHGPYQVNENECLVFREILHLYDGSKPHFSWSATEAKSPYSNIAFVFRLKDVEIELDEFVSLESKPVDFTDNITGVALLTREGKDVIPLNFDVLDHFNDYVIKANKELFFKFSKWDRRQRLIAGAYAYCYGYARYTNFVGLTDEINWDLTERTMNKYVPEFIESDFDQGIPRFFRSRGKKKREGPSLYLLPED
ncbi:MAG: hypothetical protein CEE43_19750 [Promethearchaeota archaeon Loki_b32]|nr:MAG: hypothetical protein CEE43_19750 [Candidatus Lokiarchaeota archaeon Loki_b32]